MKYLITGGAGFIGSHLADALIAKGHQVMVIDNLSTGRLENISHLEKNSNFDLTVESILNTDALDDLIKKSDCVVHLAAAVGVKLIMEKPVETIRTNILGTEEVLRSSTLHRKKVLIASTSEIYGKMQDQGNNANGAAEDADWMLGPTSKRRWAYAASKAIDEFLSLAYYDEKNLPVIVTRFFNTVGPRQTGRYGMVIPRFVRRALPREPIQVYGDGEQRRCFTYVGDAVDAVINLLNTPKAYGQVVNIGNTSEISINDLAQMVKDITKSSSPIVHVPYDEVFGHGFEDMRRRTPDITKIQSLIKFKSTKSVKEVVGLVIDEMKRK